MIAKPKVSIIVPVYNGAEYLAECLDSILAQNYTNKELIIVDDGSTDSTPDIITNYCKSHNNIEAITQSNHGQGYARNRALAKATGKYVLFVDADDRILPALLETTVGEAQQTNADLVHFNWQRTDDDEKGLAESRRRNVESFSNEKVLEGDDCERYLEKQNYWPWDALYRKAFLDNNNIRFAEGIIYEDTPFITMVGSYAEHIALIDKPFYEMRHNMLSTTRSSYNTPVHYRDFMKAQALSWELLRPRTKYAQFRLGAVFLEKFVINYQNRVPRKYLRSFRHDFVDLVSRQDFVTSGGRGHKFMRQCLDNNVFQAKKYTKFYILLLVKLYIVPILASLKSLAGKR